MFTTKDDLNDILKATIVVGEDHEGDTLLFLYDGSVWTVLQDKPDNSFYLIPMELPEC